jgi:hypothetical protein
MAPPQGGPTCFPNASSKYRSIPVEQEYRGIQSRTGPMLGFKNFDSAAIILAKVELLDRIH